MITKDYFTARISEASMLLNGKYLTKDHEQAMYERLKDEDPSDFSKAITDLIDNGDKISFPALRNLILKYKYTREEYRYLQQKKQEERDLRNFLNATKNITCKGGDCYKCPNNEYCPTILDAYINSLKNILSGSTSYSEENKKLSSLFKGLHEEAA